MFNWREVQQYSKIAVDKKEYKTNYDIKNDLIEPLKTVKWSNKKFTWNNYNFYRIIGFEPMVRKTETRCYVIMDNNYLQISEQSFFEINFLLNMKKFQKDWFDDEGFVNNDIIYSESKEIDKTCTFYRVDIKIKVSDYKFITIEFLNIDNCELRNEESRILQILNKNSIAKVFVFWTAKLDDKKYFKKFIKEVCKTIENYKNIDDEEYFCIQEINKYIGNKLLSKCLFDAYQNKDEPIIEIEELNNIIQFKDDDSKQKHLTDFETTILLLNDTPTIHQNLHGKNHNYLHNYIY
jgi:hypothetical protein